MERRTFWVDTDMLSWLMTKINQLAKRARKLGLQPPVLTVSDEERLEDVTQFTKIEPGEPYHEQVIQIRKRRATLEGEWPQLSGQDNQQWLALAKIEHEKDPEGQPVNLVKPFGTQGEERLEQLGLDLHQQKPNCEHCSTLRNRKTTYLLQDINSGEAKQIGSTCVDDFIAPGSLNKLALMADTQALFLDLSKMDDPGYEPTQRAARYVDTKLLLAIASLETERNGFHKSASRTPTKLAVLNEIQSPSKPVAELMQAHHRGEAHPHLSNAEAVIAHYRSSDSTNNFVANARSLASVAAIDLNDRNHNFQVGLLASLPSCYQRDMEKQKEQALDAATLLNEHYGELKQRGRLALKLTKSRLHNFHDGDKLRLTFRDSGGRTFEWLTTPSSAPDLEVGKHYHLTGTLAHHKEYKGTKFTAINRCKDFEEVPEDTPNPEFLIKKGKKARQAQAELGR